MLTSDPPEPHKERRPMQGRCSSCSHVWAVLYLPIELSVAGQVLKSMHCPNCGANSQHIYLYDEGERPSE
jgi:hypothetical protein